MKARGRRPIDYFRLFYNDTAVGAVLADRTLPTLPSRQNDLPGRSASAGVKFAADSLLEGAGFELVEMTAPLRISVRIGIHSGEVMLERSDIGDIAVHIASRIAAMAEPGQPLVSGTVRNLVAGSGLVFEDRGVHAVRGLPENLRLYAVSSIEDVWGA
jgi:class 3 adenylate cyclase